MDAQPLLALSCGCGGLLLVVPDDGLRGMLAALAFGCEGAGVQVTGCGAGHVRCAVCRRSHAVPPAEALEADRSAWGRWMVVQEAWETAAREARASEVLPLEDEDGRPLC